MALAMDLVGASHPVPSPPLLANFGLRFLIFQAFEKGVLWLQLLGPNTLICQGRFSSLKIFRLEEKESATWSQLADFLIRYSMRVRYRYLTVSVFRIRIGLSSVLIRFQIQQLP
jgi:hypothetical protein